MLRALFWDNDGVLVDTEHLYFEATREVLADIGIVLTEEMYHALLLVEGRGAWHLAEERGMSPREVATLRARRNTLYGQMLAESPRVIDGVEEVLDQLHGRYVMGVVTSSRRDHFDIIHSRSGLLRHFDFVLTGDDCSRSKPDPELYELAVGRSGIPAAECLAIEDSERGLKAAKGAGVACVVIPTPLTRWGDFRTADRVVGSVRDVPATLRLLGS